MRKIRLYDESAPIYNLRYRRIQKVKYQAITPFLCKGPIIDVGVGTGIGLASLVDFLPIVGVDGAIEMLRVASEQINDLEQKREFVSLVCAFAEALPFRDFCVPTVVCITVIQNLADIHQGLVELIRILHKDGMLAVTSLSKKFPLHELEANLNTRYNIIKKFENLADEDDGLVIQLS